MSGIDKESVAKSKQIIKKLLEMEKEGKKLGTEEKLYGLAAGLDVLTDCVDGLNETVMGLTKLCASIANQVDELERMIAMRFKRGGFRSARTTKKKEDLN